MINMGQTPTDEELNDMIQEVDEDGNGEIDYHEFLQVMNRNQKRDTDTDEELSRGFKIFDADNDGQISIDDLRKLMTQLGENLTEEELEDMIRVATGEGNDTVSFEEFTTVLQTK